jgi:hypothetical protein
MPRPLPLCAPAAISLLILAAPGLAAASPTYPGLIDTDLKLSYDLGTTHCTICHTSNSGGVGTATQPFGQAMRAAGLVLENPTALQTALNTLQADGHDSDCNGTPDIEQIQAGQDPNTGAYIDGSNRTNPVEAGCPMTSGGDLPVYGCGAQIAPGSGGSGGGASWQAAGIVVAALAAGLARSRGRRSRSCLSG